MSSVLNENIKKSYYLTHFPSSHIYRWLTYSQPQLASRLGTGSTLKYNANFFLHRELSFNVGSDIYIRYKSFPSLPAFQSALESLSPNKIDIGAIYSSPITMKSRMQGLTVQEKEYFIDIDISDYGRVRPCCGASARVCRECWPFMACAVKLLDRALREHFGFGHILWVFSGRRGIHCWVCDKRARRMGRQVRGAVSEYLNLFKGNDFNPGLVDFPLVDSSNDKGQGGDSDKGRERELHPMFVLAFEVCREYFGRIYFGKGREGQYDYEYLAQRVCEVVASKCKKGTAEKVSAIFHKGNREGRGFERMFREAERVVLEEDKSYREVGYSKCMVAVYISFVYPRLDVEVSRQMNHLLKAPFSIHPATGNVCVPLDPERIDSFEQIEDCPNVNRMECDVKKVKGGKDDRETMKQCVEFFENTFLRKLEEEEFREFSIIEHEAIVSN